LHGLAGNNQGFFRLPCLAPILPGHQGISLDSYQNLTDIANYVFQKIKDQEIKKPVVVGFSMGGLITLKMAKIKPRQIAKIVVWASPVLGLNERAQKILKIVELLPAWLFKTIQNPTILGKISCLLKMPVGRSDLQVASQMKKQDVLRLAAMMAKEKYDLKTPVRKLFIFGTNDSLVDQENYDFVKQNKRSEDKVVLVKNGGHFGTEADWSKTYQVVEKFIGSEN
jgi:pimeloyl-ACP methyl ester carboxylesterase